MTPESIPAPPPPKWAARGLRRFGSNTGWNLFGMLAPVLLGVLVVPLLVAHAGLERFAIITLAWSLISSWGIFDLGLSRAVTKVTVERRQDPMALAQVLGTSSAVAIAAGMVIGIALALTTPFVVNHLHVSGSNTGETQAAFYVIAVGVPLVTLSATLRGYLEAAYEFAQVAIGRSVVGVFTFAGPLVMLPFTRSLSALVGALVLGRLVTVLLFLYWGLRCQPVGRPCVSVNLLREVVAFSGWSTVGSSLTPTLTYLDRVLIGAISSVASLAYYAVPFEFATKIWLLPTAVVGALFPTMVRPRDPTHHDERKHFATLTYQLLLLSMLPPIAAGIALAPEILRVWLGGPFAIHGALVARALLVGVFVSGLSFVPLAIIHANGRPDLVVKFQLAVSPLYVVAVVIGLRNYGIGALAVLWAARLALESGFIFWLAGHLQRTEHRAWTLQALVVVPGAASVLILPMVVDSFPLRCLYTFVIAGACIVGLIITVKANLRRDDETESARSTQIPSYRTL